MKLNSKTINIIGLTLLIVLSFALRVHFLSVPMTTDEGGCAYTALFWPSHQELYKDINLDRMQGLFLVFKTMLMFLGTGVEAFRIGAALFNILTLMTVFFFALKLHSRKAAWISGLIYAFISVSPAIEGFTASSELFTILPITLSAFFLWKNQWTYAGFFAGLSMMFKPIGISSFLFLILWFIAIKPGWKIFFRSAAASLLFPLLSILHCIYIGWEHVWNTFVTSRLTASSAASYSFGTQFENFIPSLHNTSSAWIHLFLFSVIGLIITNKRVRVFGGIWILTSFFGMSLGGEWHAHYFMQLIPPVTVLGSIGIIELFKKSKTFKWTALFIVVVSAIWFITFQGRYWFLPPNQISWNLFRRAEYLSSTTIADYINRTTRKNDSIYVAFAQADIYYLARRVSAIPQQLYWLQVNHNKEIWDKVVKAIEEGKPEIILWIQAPPSHFSSSEDFDKLIRRKYNPERKYGHIRLYRKKPAGLTSITHNAHNILSSIIFVI